MAIYQRAYQGKIDDQQIRKFLSHTYTLTHHPYFFLDLPNWERTRATFNPKKQIIQLWELAQHPVKTVVAMALYEPHHRKLSYLVEPNYGNIDKQILKWAEHVHGGVNTKTGKKTLLKCAVCEKNERQKAILTQRGYTKSKMDTVFRKRTLNEAISRPILPAGYRIEDAQDFSPEILAQRVDVENRVFDRMITVTFLQELKQAPSYRQALDLIVVDHAGRIAAFCTVWFDATTKVGFVEPIGTVTDYRRQGLAKALLLEGFQRLQKIGAMFAYLGNNAQNKAGNQLYEFVNMPTFDEECLWQKEL